jgi:mannose-6-phosphate isomerase
MTMTEDLATIDGLKPGEARVSPFLLKPKFAARIWGKLDLKPWYEETGIAEKVGEAWLTGPECVIATGPLAGKTLDEAAKSFPGQLGDGEFPLLVKMLFPSDKLSVQVHPNDEEAQKIGLPRGKTECWYVLEAEPNATVACGLKSGVTLEDVRAAIIDGTLEDKLEMVPVAVGDMVFVDAGTVHAIGPGVTLLEVQQTCDVTYRLFDYGRPRELHLDEGLAVVKLKTAAGKIEPLDKTTYTRLIETKYFVVDRIDICAGDTVEMPMDGIGCVVGLKGDAAVNDVELTAGQAVVMPIGSAALSSRHGATVARCRQPEK